MASLHGRCLTAIRTLFQTLDIEGITTDLIAVRKLPIHVKGLIPGISICPVQETIEQDENVTDLIGYGCQVIFVMPSNQDSETFADIDNWLEARELMLDIILPLDNEPLPGIPKARVGIKSPPRVELLAAPGPSRPSTAPLPARDLSFRPATA